MSSYSSFQQVDGSEHDSILEKSCNLTNGEVIVIFENSQDIKSKSGNYANGDRKDSLLSPTTGLCCDIKTDNSSSDDTSYCNKNDKNNNKNR